MGLIFLLYSKSGKVNKIIKLKPKIFNINKLSIIIAVLFFVMTVSFLFWKPIYIYWKNITDKRNENVGVSEESSCRTCGFDKKWELGRRYIFMAIWKKCKVIIMKNIYYFIYVRLYKIYAHLGEKDIPHIIPVFLMSLFLYFNLSGVYCFLGVQFFSHFHDKISIPIGLAIFAFNCFVFLYKQKYKRIIDEYDLEERHFPKWVVNIIMILYIVLSISFWIYAGYQVRCLNIK